MRTASHHALLLSLALGPLLAGCPTGHPVGLDGASGAETQLTSLRSEVEALTAALSEEQTRAKRAEATSARLATRRALWESAVRRLRAQATTSTRAIGALSALVRGAGLDQEAARDLPKALSGIQRSLSEVRDARHALATEVAALAGRVGELEGTMAAVRRRHGGEVQDLERRIAKVDRDLSTIVESLRIHTNIPNINVQVPRIEGEVLEVETGPEGPRVLLSVGAVQGVQERYEFQVYRGDKMVAKILVIEVADHFASARIIRTLKGGVRVGDRVTTRS